MRDPGQLQSGQVSGHSSETAHLPRVRAPLWARAAFLASIAVAIAVVLRRLAALASPGGSGPPQLVALDQVFASRAALTLAHIIPALVFVVIAAIVVLRPASAPAWLQPAIYPLGAIVGFTAYAMTTYSVGGWVERAAVFVFDSWFLFSLFRAFGYRRRGRPETERRWLVRAILVLLGIATTRPVMGIFFATSALTHLTPSQFFGYAFWAGFSINAIAVELWLHAGDRRARLAGNAAHTVR